MFFMPLIMFYHCWKWTFRLIFVKQGDVLMSIDDNDSELKFNVEIGQIY